jgi:hypothetical protein
MPRLSRLSSVAGFLILLPATSVIGQGASPQTSVRTDSPYSSLEKDFRVGKRVYLRSSKMLIGRIIAIDPIHSFPPSFGRTRAKALLIKRKDGPLDWMPVDGALRIYVVK